MASVLIYTRLSTDDVNGSTDRQQAACRAYAEARGWTVADVRTDTDASAYRGTPRPAFDALVEDCNVRSADGILVWKLDRLVRRPADFERLWAVADRRGVFVASVMEPVDSSSPIGLALLRILVALAGLESATTGIRIAAQRRSEALAGKPPATKAYGLTRDWTAIVPEEAAIIREMALRASEGERMNQIARDFQLRGINAPGGGAWTGASMGNILKNPRLVGDRRYRGEIVARDCFPAILDREFFARLQLEICHPKRQGAPRQHRKRLATGRAVCGLCRQNMQTTTRSGVRYYSCPTHPTGCGRMHVHADRTDDWLLDQLLERLTEPVADATAPLPDTLETARAMEELCRDYYVERLLSRDDFLASRALLVRRAETISRDSGQHPDVARILASADPRRALGAVEIDVQRQLLHDRLGTVTVNPTVEPGKRFSAERLQCEWNEAESGTDGEQPAQQR